MTSALPNDFASARRPLLTVVPDLSEPESDVWVEVDGETVCAFGFILLALVALTKFLVGFDWNWARLGWYLLAAVAAPPLIMIAASLRGRAVAHFDVGYDRASVERHEGGHVRVARAAGCSASVEYKYDPKTDNWSGSVYLSPFSRSPEAWQSAAIAFGGQVAAGNTIGCGTDQAIFADAIKAYPRAERAERERKAIEFARRHAK